MEKSLKTEIQSLTKEIQKDSTTAASGLMNKVVNILLVGTATLWIIALIALIISKTIF